MTEVINSSVEDISATTHSFLIGNAIADAGSTLNMSLASNSLWSGAAMNVNNLIIDSSIWDLTGSSTVNNLTNDGLIHFVPNGNNFKTLTVNNDYVGLNGTINLNTFIQGSESLSDLIVINSGHASGSTSLNIYNTSGLGALTSGNGILIVDAINGGTTDNSAFNLGSPVVAGPFEYRLYRSGIDGSNEHNWYLRDVCPPDRPLCSLEPAPDTSPLVPRNAEYRSEIGLYPVLSAMTLLYGQTLLDSLHQRVGPGSSSNRIWNRAIGLHGDRNRLTNKNPLRSSDYDYNFGIIQLGGDLLQRETEGNKRHHLGIYGAIGQGQGDVKGSNFTLGSNQFGALSAGAYWTIYSAIEAYVDTVVQTTWYNQAQSKSYRLSALKTDGWGFAASVEGGYPIIFNKQWTIEPQAQAIVQTINLHNTKDIGAFIHFRETDAVTGRLGVRLAHKWVIDNHGQSKDFTTWIRPNLWYQFKGNPQAQFSSAYGFIPFQAQLEGSSVELNLGTSLGIGQNIALYANGSYGVGLNMHMNSYDGRIGFKIMVA
ncbi:MAG: autotransporter outer membrane beta-barrel domain-containing protein [Legionella sp.]|uniref:autotransporter family protein n=1 Tax=Legionella sp. TaxID=459 RepID=UPI0028437421|nr:autotransporter outer membrane beta-barrel domain-containing protein [Legionella sp.]